MLIIGLANSIQEIVEGAVVLAVMLTLNRAVSVS